jgi:U2 small nuclear ribonucleoprotein B''
MPRMYFDLVANFTILLQRIAYAKGKSNKIAKLDGTFAMPTKTPAPGEVAATELQQSIFGGPPGSFALNSASEGAGLKPPGVASPAAAPSPQGVKRRREDEGSEDDQPMDEESDGDASMEASSDED